MNSLGRPAGNRNMLLATILIRQPGDGPEPALPSIVAENIESFGKHHPGVRQRTFTHDDIVELLNDRFSREVLDSFNSLKPFAYKADLARYCIMHAFGGAYADLSYYFVGPLPLGGNRIVVFRDFTWSSPWDTSNGVFVFPPGHKALERAIELVCANVKRAYYGSTSLCPTGPALFGKALACTCESEELITGTAIRVDRQRVEERVPNVSLPDGEQVHCLVLGTRLVAIKRKRSGAPGLTELGISGGNAHLELWKSRDIYSEDRATVSEGS